ncbi:phage tail collar domain protein [Geotalea daltonii FRC-32]|uniref:Phage tail collar domain protein n=1 Tax=Geotalea daltonii (strain DSM 22248 / JCM 15807 / FRC-32) TaxID=316067 RepID=B9M3Z7_GEODF|nr:tail fiber protein [Geotalea daltonii]ACM19640.1 phage tail collar domain protein [Geotalea daltonii FRC-32]
MSDQFIGEIRMFGGNFAPVDWALCDGSTLQISQYDVLYAVIGTYFGGDGITNFKLPDFRGRIPVHMGTGQGLTPRGIGNAFGTEQETLQVAHIPAHNHVVSVGANATTAAPAGNYLGNSSNFSLYSTAAADSLLNQDTVGFFPAAPAQPHSNMMPSLCVNFIIATNGYYPQRP